MTKLLQKIKAYFKAQREQEDLKRLIAMDYRLEKEIMAIRS